MINIKVKFRPSSVEGRFGTVYYQLSYHSKSRQITTRYHISPESWDAEEGLRTDSEEYVLFQSQIEKDIDYIHQIVNSLEMTEDIADLSDVVLCYKQTQSRKCVLEYMREEIRFLMGRSRMVTARNYDRTMRSFSNFLGGYDVPFSMFTESLVNSYEDYLIARGLLRNSSSFYMRILRALYNKAVKRHYVVQTHPFQNVYTGIDYTRKRAIGEQWIAKLYQLPLPQRTTLELARDMFIFSYCTRGMAFVDMVHLKKSDVKYGQISYFRHKTKQPLCIRVEVEVKQILTKYRSYAPKSPYVFPILKGDDVLRDFKRYYVKLNTYNRMLKKLALMMGYKCNLTSYVARHSWATTARNHKVPLSVISAGLGHDSERTTEIYLRRMENSVIDSANREIIKSLKQH